MRSLHYTGRRSGTACWVPRCVRDAVNCFLWFYTGFPQSLYGVINAQETLFKRQNMTIPGVSRRETSSTRVLVTHELAGTRAQILVSLKVLLVVATSIDKRDFVLTSTRFF